jgi:hypothetical protein
MIQRSGLPSPNSAQWRTPQTTHCLDPIMLTPNSQSREFLLRRYWLSRARRRKLFILAAYNLLHCQNGFSEKVLTDDYLA